LRAWLPLSALLFLLVPLTTIAGQREVEERLACQCGCGLTVHSCNHLQCSFAVPVREDIAKSLASGQSEDQIVVRYVQEYGEKVLSAPTREGFNLLAWWGPYVALVAGGLVLLFTIRRMNREQPGESDRNRTVLPIADSERAQIDRELEDYEP